MNGKAEVIKSIASREFLFLKYMNFCFIFTIVN